MGIKQNGIDEKKVTSPDLASVYDNLARSFLPKAKGGRLLEPAD